MNKKMNIVFFGSSQFAVPSLRALLDAGHKISCVVTQPDKEVGRGLSLAGTAVKRMALEAHLNVYQPERINTDKVIKFLKTLNADLSVVIAYGQILSQGILDIPKIFSLNVHGSFLPKYRGAAPINWAIIKGEKITGVTVIRMVKEMDAGPIILQKTVNISGDDTSFTLEDKLSRVAAGLLLDSLESIEHNDYNLVPQDESEVSLAPKLKKEDGQINWHKPSQDIYNLVKGCQGWPGAFTYYKGKLLKIHKARVGLLASSPVRLLPGEILKVSKDGITVATGKDNLIIEELQIEGKRRMKAEEFIAGHKICIGEILSKKIIA